MGAKTWMLVYADGDTDIRQTLQSRPQLDRDETHRVAQSLFPRDKPISIGETDLSWTNPKRNEIHIGCFAGVSIVAAKEFAVDNPSKLPEQFKLAGRHGTMILHAMISTVDWFAYARWVNGDLTRSLSISPDTGAIEDIGTPLPFERPFWAGEHPVEIGDEEHNYPLPFHPLEMGEAALYALYGYELEGFNNLALFDPESISLIKFKRSRQWWKLW